MPGTSLEKLVPEQDFAVLLKGHSGSFAALVRRLLDTPDSVWTRRYFYQLASEADSLESFLDDYGARYNRTYNSLTEYVASLRGFALAGFGVQHLSRRLEGYRVAEGLSASEADELNEDVDRVRAFLCRSLKALLDVTRAELVSLSVDVPSEADTDELLDSVAPRFHLPHDVGQEKLVDEEQRIAGVASKFLQACTMLEDLGVQRFADPDARKAFISGHCSEEDARVYEATVHNLQSSYDTYIKNTVLEARDKRLGLLRGHISTSLHLLEVATQLTHFVERHEAELRQSKAGARIAELIDREEVRSCTVDTLLFWAVRVMTRGRELAEELLPNYINLQQLEVELEDGIMLHARPASLIVNIVNHHGTPVEMEIADAGTTCNAASILELMIAVGSNPEARSYVFRGDAKPLKDIRLLFEHHLGEKGLEELPARLSYLRI